MAATEDYPDSSPYLDGWGPKTRVRLIRLAAIYAGLYGSGLLLVWTAAAPG